MFSLSNELCTSWLYCPIAVQNVIINEQNDSHLILICWATDYHFPPILLTACYVVFIVCWCDVNITRHLQHYIYEIHVISSCSIFKMTEKCGCHSQQKSNFYTVSATCNIVMKLWKKFIFCHNAEFNYKSVVINWTNEYFCRITS